MERERSCKEKKISPSLFKRKLPRKPPTHQSLRRFDTNPFEFSAMMLAGTCPKRVLILAWTAVFAMSMGDEEGELTKAAIEEMNRAMLEGDEAGMGTHDSAEAKQRFAEEGNMAAYTLAGVEEQLMAPEGQIHHRMLGEHLLWMMRANGATAVQYYWQGNLERASRHYAIGVHAGRRYKAYEHHFNGQLTKNEDGHWAYMNEYKLNMLPLLAMLHRQRIRQGHITPSPRPQVSQRENGDEPETCKAKLDAFGAQTSPLAKKALARVPKISPSTLRVDFLEPSGENFFEMLVGCDCRFRAPGPQCRDCLPLSGACGVVSCSSVAH